jgi:hypothetical protein
MALGEAFAAPLLVCSAAGVAGATGAGVAGVAAAAGPVPAACAAFGAALAALLLEVPAAAYRGRASRSPMRDDMEVDADE